MAVMGHGGVSAGGTAMPRGKKAKRTSSGKRKGPRVGESRRGRALAASAACVLRSNTQRNLVHYAGWNDLPGELHCEVLRLVPLRDATAARWVSREMRDEVDEVWRAWGIQAKTPEHYQFYDDDLMRLEFDAALSFGPLAVYEVEGSHTHHLACLGQRWLTQLMACEELGLEIDESIWIVDRDLDLLKVAVRARRVVGRGAGGKAEWAYVLGDEEVVKVVEQASERWSERFNWPGWWGAEALLLQCAKRGCLGGVKACLRAGAGVHDDDDDEDAYELRYQRSEDEIFHVTTRWPPLIYAARAGHEAVVEALLEAGAPARVGWHREYWTFPAVCGGRPTSGILRRLAEAGADVNSLPIRATYRSDDTIRSGEYPSALMMAARGGKLEMAQTLVELGASVSAVNMEGLSAMHVAADGEMVRWLAAHGGDVNSQGIPDNDDGS